MLNYYYTVLSHMIMSVNTVLCEVCMIIGSTSKTLWQWCMICRHSLNILDPSYITFLMHVRARAAGEPEACHCHLNPIYSAR